MVIAHGGGVDIAVRVNFSAADEGDHSVSVLEPLVGLEANVANRRPLHRAVRHEAAVTDRGGNLNGIAVDQAALNNECAAGGKYLLGNSCADERKTCSNNRDMIVGDRAGNRNCLHFFVGVIRVVSHYFFSSFACAVISTW